MKHVSLASKYRPQSFKEVVGQNLATTALSRASSEDRVASAYLLSGTRGVGKTTVARIFSKALNCQTAPAAEPCNNCPQCARITAGNHVDVAEIDGASNTGVDDVRALRENIGYLPMEGRYKIFIIDEAHMLSKSAFNALLKTLEEPPGHTVFIFATTEAHKFPATIISRCQHFVFRSLPQDLIANHLRKVLEREAIPFEESAVNLVARRAAGSVRDSLSLLDQALALSGRNLTSASVREGLGLAGPEFFAELFSAIPDRECAKILDLSGQLLQSGADLGFFTRELSGWLRNLFLYRQQGSAILPALRLTPDEEALLKDHAGKFEPAHLHAAWQMALENQRSITQSPEPGAALEMLLINLALIPQLLPVGKVAPQASTPPPEDKKKTLNQAPPETSPAVSPVPSAGPPPAPRPWQEFCQFCKEKEAKGEPVLPNYVLAHLKPAFADESLRLDFPSAHVAEHVKKAREILDANLREFYNLAPENITYAWPEEPKTYQEVLDECAKSPEVELCQEILNATLVDWTAKTSAPNSTN